MQQGVQTSVKDATLRPGQCNWLCSHPQICGILCHRPGKHLAKNRVGGFHLDLLVGLFEGNQDKVMESINEGRVHVDDVVALLECHAMGDFDVGAIIGLMGKYSGSIELRNFHRNLIFPIVKFVPTNL